MARERLARYVPRALAVVALLALAGCQQLIAQRAAQTATPGAPAGRATSSPPPVWGATEARSTKLTPAQEADLQIAFGREAERRGDLDGAMSAYRDALRRDDQRSDAHLRTAILLDQQGRFQESAESYRRALKLRPGDPEIFCDMGYSLYLQRRWVEAEIAFKQALAVDPGMRRAHNNLALVLAHTDRHDEALGEFRKGGNSPADAHGNLAFALTLDRKWRSARGHYQAALAADPASATRRARLGEFERLAGRLEQASPTTPVGDPQVALASHAGSPRPTAAPKPAAAPSTAAPSPRPAPSPEASGATEIKHPEARPAGK